MYQHMHVTELIVIRKLVTPKFFGDKLPSSGRSSTKKYVHQYFNFLWTILNIKIIKYKDTYLAKNWRTGFLDKNLTAALYSCLCFHILWLLFIFTFYNFKILILYIRDAFVFSFTSISLKMAICCRNMLEGTSLCLIF